MGSVVECPRCKKSVVVPPQSAPQAEQLYQLLKNKQAQEQAAPPPPKKASVAEPTVPESAWDELGGNVNDTELNRWIDELWKTTSNSQSGVFFPPPLTPDAAAAEEMVLVALKKKYLYTLTLLFVLLPAAFFVGLVFGILVRGFYIQSAPTVQAAGEQKIVNELTGTLFYLDDNGKRLPDADAVIICLPKDRSPSPLLSCQGLRPEDPVNNGTVQLILELGGMYGRADVNGSFALEYREGMRYYVIMISAHKIQSVAGVKPGILQELRRYFSNPELFGENCLTTDEFEESGGKHSLKHTFETTE